MSARTTPGDAASVLGTYYEAIDEHLRALRDTQAEAIDRAAALIAEHAAEDRLVHVYGPGGHSNLASQEIFFRAGGLVNISAILDAGTLLSNGALRSMHVERSHGYGRLVVEDNQLGAGDLLILVNAYGINSTVVDAAIAAREKGVTVIGVSSRIHAESTPADHPARHPSGRNLHEVVDLHVDTQVPVGDAVLLVDDVADPVAAISTFANAYVLQALMATAIAKVGAAGVAPPIWTSANASGGDDRNAQHVERFKHRVRWL